MIFNPIFQLLNKKFIRNINSVAPDIVSSLIKVDQRYFQNNSFAALLNDKELKINEFKTENTNGIDKYLIYPGNLDSFVKICSCKIPVIADRVRRSSTITIPNCLIIKFKNDLSDELKSIVQKHPNLTYDIMDKRTCQVFCNDTDDFNSIFFMNKEDPNIQRFIVPFIDSPHLKLTPNILSVVLPSDVDTVYKAMLIFADYKFNRISMPTSTGSWLFYLENEKDYLKMLSTPNYYAGQIVIVRPYYGTPLIYASGRRTPEKIIHIYYDGKSAITKNCGPFTGFYRYYLKKFENKYVLSFYFKNMDDFNKLKYSNGLNLFGENKYTMVIGDEISASNLVSPKLIIKLKLDSEPKSILTKIMGNISWYFIKNDANGIYLSVNPKSLNDYNTILNTEFETEGKSNYFTPEELIPSYSLLLNSILVKHSVYAANKLYFDNNKEIKIKKFSNQHFIIYCKRNKTENVLFDLSKLNTKSDSFYRNSSQILQANYSCAISTLRWLIVPTSNLDSIQANIKTRFISQISRYDPRNTFIMFNNNRDAQAPLFDDIQFYTERSNYYGLKLQQIKSEESVLVTNNNYEFPNAFSVKYNINVSPISSNGDLAYYHVKLESLHDLSNFISFADNFNINDYNSVRFLPGNDVFNL